MKILHVSSSFKPSWETGGTCRVAYDISKALAEKGHRISAFTTDRGIAASVVDRNRPVDVDGIETYYFRNISKRLADYKMVTPYYLPFVVKGKMADFDIVHIHEHRTVLASIVAHYALKAGVPYVVQPHGSVLPSFGKGRLKLAFDALLGGKTIKGATRFIALSESEVSQICSIGVPGNRIRLIRNGIDAGDYEILPQRGGFRRKIGASESNRIILYLGRIHRMKGLTVLIMAFSSILKEFPDARLAFVGRDDGILSDLKDKTASLGLTDRVSFSGPLYSKEKIEAYVDASVLVLPSEYETYPVTLLEALASGTRVVTTCRCGLENLIEDRGGMVVNFGVDEIAKGITFVLRRTVNGHLTTNSRTQILRDFDWRNVVDTIEKIYEEAIEEHG